MAVYAETPVMALNIYKYSRTKLFKVLVSNRLSSHHTLPHAYQDIPWWFNFDETDPVDWSLSIPELDKQLIKVLLLEEFTNRIMEETKPFASVLDNISKEKLRKELEKNNSDIIVEIDEIDCWYD